MMRRGPWKEVPLQSAFWFQEGPGVRTWQFQSEGVKLLNVANIEKSGTLNLSKTHRCLDANEVAKKYSHFLVQAGDFVIASSGISFDDDGLLRTRGAFVEEHHLPLCLNTSTIRFKATDGVSSLRFFRHWLDTVEFRSQVSKLVTGTSQQNFGPTHLKNIRISMPSVDEQQRLAEVLDRAEALRTKRRAALAQLDALVQSIFLDLFGDPATNSKKWPMSTVGELANVQGGLQVSHARSKLPVQVPYLRVGNVYRNVLDLREVKLMHVTQAEAERTKLAKDDLLIVEGHGNPDEIGRSCLWDGSIEPCVHQNHLIRARFAAERVDPLYGSYFLNSQGGRKHLLKAGRTTTGLNTISVADVRETPIAVPPSDLQRDFARRIAAVEKLKSTMRTSLAELDALFASLQHRAFRGEL